MTITTEVERRILREMEGAAPRQGGYTLVELLVVLGLSGFLLTAILTTFIFIARGGTRLMHYRDIETRAALALQQFAVDARQATSVTWGNTNRLSMDVASAGTIIYVYNSATGVFTRQTPAGNLTLASDINTFRFGAFDRDGTALNLAAANINSRTKMVQMEIGFRSRSRTVVPVESDIISARYMLRNKASN